jgi:hypothetical protein
MEKSPVFRGGDEKITGIQYARQDGVFLSPESTQKGGNFKSRTRACFPFQYPHHLVIAAEIVIISLLTSNSGRPS